LRVLVLSSDAIGAKMAGPAIRSWELATALSEHHAVTLAVPPGDHRPTNQFAIAAQTRNALSGLVASHDVVLVQGPRLVPVLHALRHNKPLVIDLYDPYFIEALEVSRSTPSSSAGRVRSIMATDIARLQLLAGDFFLCAGERQRDMWIGMLAGVGRLRPALHSADPSLRKLIDVVSFGLPDRPPETTRRVLKGIHPGIAESDKVLLWGGGIWNWLDPITPIRALQHLQHRPDIKLFFMGLARPNAGTVNLQAAEDAVKLSQDLGLYGNTVLFNHDWVPYDDRGNYLLESDVGLSAHGDHLETRFAFRTRLLDCIWAGLPIICTEGDELSDLVRQEGLGIALVCGDPESMAAAILRLVDDEAFRRSCYQNLRRVAARLTWREVARPLLDFCTSPRVTSDKSALRRGLLMGKGSILLARIVRRNLG
jgi:hypothetical protein